jgi:MYXO-CTERM domain-containing protein
MKKVRQSVAMLAVCGMFMIGSPVLAQSGDNTTTGTTTTTMDDAREEDDGSKWGLAGLLGLLGLLGLKRRDDDKHRHTTTTVR